MGEQVPAGTAVSVTLNEVDLLGLHCLATLEEVPLGDSAGLSDLLARTVRRGLMGRFELAGLPWPPTPETLEMAEHVSVEETPAAESPAAASRRRDIRYAAIAGLLVATTIVLIGGYVDHWAWTGFTANGQLWDWMNLLLLPVAFGTLPLWLRFADRMAPLHRRALGGCALAFVLFALAGYLAPLVWTGFPGQTLWNWLTLIVLPITITAVRAWPATAREIRPIHLTALTSLTVGWAVTLVGGYALDWTWTGYVGNTLWDWLQLLLAPIAINIFLVPALIKLVSGNVAERAEREQARLAREKALSAARERMTGM